MDLSDQALRFARRLEAGPVGSALRSPLLVALMLVALVTAVLFYALGITVRQVGGWRPVGRAAVYCALAAGLLMMLHQHLLVASLGEGMLGRERRQALADIMETGGARYTVTP